MTLRNARFPALFQRSHCVLGWIWLTAVLPKLSKDLEDIVIPKYTNYTESFQKMTCIHPNSFILALTDPVPGSGPTQKEKVDHQGNAAQCGNGQPWKKFKRMKKILRLKEDLKTQDQSSVLSFFEHLRISSAHFSVIWNLTQILDLPQMHMETRHYIARAFACCNVVLKNVSSLPHATTVRCSYKMTQVAKARRHQTVHSSVPGCVGQWRWTRASGHCGGSSAASLQTRCEHERDLMKAMKSSGSCHCRLAWDTFEP